MSDDEFEHEFCVSIDEQRREYARSPGFEICDADGNFDPAGMFVKRPSGKVFPFHSHCDNPPCTKGRVKEPLVIQSTSTDEILDRLEKRLAVSNRTKAK